MAKLYNLARVSTATAGTGTITLGAAVSGYLTFALAGVTNGQVVSYGIKDGANSEVGTGTYTADGTILTRTVTKSTNADAAISLSGTAEVFITPRKEDLLSITETATTNHVFAGASSGGAAAPAFRALVAADLPAASDTAIGGIEIADQTEMEAASSTTVAVTPGRVQYHPGVAKAWVKADGSTAAVSVSHNITSTTDTGTGQLTITIATNFSGTSWVALMSLEAAADTGASAEYQNFTGVIDSSSPTITAVLLKSLKWTIEDDTIGDQLVAAADPAHYHFAAFGDQ